MRPALLAANDRESVPSIGRLTHLPRGSVRSLHGTRGQAVAVFTGRVWLTRHGERRDIVLAAGDTWAFDRDGEAVVEALADAYVVLFDLAWRADDQPAVWQPEPGHGRGA